MSASVTVRYKSDLAITEKFDTDVAGAGQTQNPFSTSAQLNATSSPAVSEGGFCQQLLTAGAATIDLTSVATTRGRTMTFSGLKIRAIRIKALSTNSNPLTIAKGASNGYTGFGSAFSITLKPGQEITFYDNGAGVAVSGSVKALDLSGTGTEGIQFSISGGA